MGLTLNILSSGAQPGRETVFPMSGDSMTLGRSETNDVVLPDPTREISSSHAVIQFRAGDYLIVDTSTNGTFRNNDAEPLGDLPTPLDHGDVLRIGAYELQVSIEAGAKTGDPFADLPPPLGEEPIVEDKGGSAMEDIAGIDTSGGDVLDDLLGAPPPNAARMQTRSSVDFDDEIIDDYLDVERDPNREGGASSSNHSSPANDFFSSGSAGGAIPDDWDDDFLSGIGSSGQGKPAAPKSPPSKGLIPETSFSDQPFEIPKPGQKAKPAAPPERDPIDDLLAARAKASVPDPDPDDLPDPAPAEDEPPVAPPAKTPPPRKPEATQPEPEPIPEPEPEPAPPPPPPKPAPAPAARTVPPPKPAPAPAAAPGPATNQDLARRFLEAAGVDHKRIPDEELGEIMERTGTVFRVLIEGAREVLMARTSIKDEFRLDKTEISPDGNNPIKFSISGQQAVEAMVKPTVAGYQPGDKAAAEAMRDIRAHEMAMMSGMETAIKALLVRFNPTKLGETIEKSGLLGGLLRNKKAQYWDAFEKLYLQISDEAEEDFNALFGKSFARAYKEQMSKLKQQQEKK